jgi:hypothetical protein
LLATGDIHVARFVLDATRRAEFDEKELTHVQIVRDHDHADDNMAAKAQLIKGYVESFTA